MPTVVPSQSSQQPAPAASKDYLPKRKSLRLLWVGLFVAVIVSGILGWRYQETLEKVVEEGLRLAGIQTKANSNGQNDSRPNNSSKKSGGRPTAVGVAVAVQRDLPVYLTGIGTVTATNTVTVKTRVDGELIKVSFQEGQSVEAGELLAEVDPRPFDAALGQAEGQLARDQATLQLSKLTLGRLESLKLQNATSQQELDEQKALVAQSEAVVAIGRSNVENARLQLSYTRITSPIRGRVGLRLIDKGNIVKANDTGGLAVITELNPIAVIFTIPQDDIPRLQSHSSKQNRLVVEAFNRDLTTRLATGELTALNNQVDAATGTLRLKATFVNAENSLFPNQFVNARLLIETIPNAIVVPSIAIQRGPDFRYVYVVRDDETVELRKVQLGPSDGTETSIVEGIALGEVVVINGMDKLQSNAKVVLPKRRTDSAG